jgi:hypothetical protein
VSTAGAEIKVNTANGFAEISMKELPPIRLKPLKNIQISRANLNNSVMK